MNQLLQTQPEPFSILALDCGYFTHVAFISDRIGADGYPMLIGASERTGTVKEEMWSDIVGGSRFEIIENPGELSVVEVLRNARNQIGNWRYNLLNNNCEHFVNWASGLPKTSKQVASGVMLGATVAAATYALAEENKGLKALAGLALGAYIGVQLSK